jgi:hypothetical protein
MSALLLTTALIGAMQRRSALAGLAWHRVVIAFDCVSTGAGTLDGSGKLGVLIRWAWAYAAEGGHVRGSLAAVALLLLAVTCIQQLDALTKSMHHGPVESLLS